MMNKEMNLEDLKLMSRVLGNFICTQKLEEPNINNIETLISAVKAREKIEEGIEKLEKKDL